MPRRIIDVTGLRFGRLQVMERMPKTEKAVKWLCKCDCGNEVIVSGSNLKHGNVKSCGCLRKENSKKMRLTHGDTGKRLYKIWDAMRQRCTNPNFKFYKDYGGRGITVCQEWAHNYKAFREWAYANGYSESLSIDRKDNDSGYCPDNCRWTTAKEQANNRRPRKKTTE